MADEETQPVNIANFNKLAGLIFSMLLESFPIPLDIEDGEEKKLAEGMGLEVTTQDIGNGFPPSLRVAPLGELPFYAVMVSTLGWLAEEGFIRARGDAHVVEVVLTSRAFTALNTPDGGDATLGQKLSKAAKSAGSTTGNAVLTQTVVQLIGLVARHII